MTNNRKCTLAIAMVLATGATMATAGPASARGGADRVLAHGQCSGHATWKLKAKPDDSRVEVEFEVDSNRAGQSWTVRLRDNGDRFFAGTRTTKGPSGSFSVTKFTANRAGDDVIRARAVHNEQVCHGSVTLPA
jgi:hypothetical protein